MKIQCTGSVEWKTKTGEHNDYILSLLVDNIHKFECELAEIRSKIKNPQFGNSKSNVGCYIYGIDFLKDLEARTQYHLTLAREHYTRELKLQSLVVEEKGV